MIHNLIKISSSGFTKLHISLVVLVTKCQSSLIFCCKIPILCQSLERSAQIVLVMSDRNDEFVNSGSYAQNCIGYDPHDIWQHANNCEFISR